MTDDQYRPRAAYGVAVTGLEAEDHLLSAGEPGWPAIRIVVDPSPAERGRAVLGEDAACFPEARSGHVAVNRRTGVAAFRGTGLTTDEIVHPRLGMLGALVAQWLPGRVAFHAGAFVSEGRAWAVVGERGDGKSTLMAALALSGLPVLGDDTLVLDSDRCLPGVRCVDLRPDAVDRLGVRDAVGTVRGGDRERLLLGPVAPSTPLAGWLFLRWSDELSLRPLPAGERIARLGRARGWHRRGVTEPHELLRLAALPAWEVARPRDWARLPEVLERVVALTTAVDR